MAPSKRTTPAAFQFYPRDFLASDKVGRMSLAELGAYITLLCYAWLGRGLPQEPAQLARLLKLTNARFARMWAGVLSECFVVHRGKLVNPRQEWQREELEAYIASCKKGGERSAKSRRERYGTSQPARSGLRSETEVAPNTASASASASSKVPPPKNGGGTARATAPLHDTSHKHHVHCGRICVHSSQHDALVRRRNHLQADTELRAFYLEINALWSTAPLDIAEPGDPFDFWRDRYAERWPTAPKKSAAQSRLDTWQPASSVRP